MSLAPDTEIAVAALYWGRNNSKAVEVAMSLAPDIEIAVAALYWGRSNSKAVEAAMNLAHDMEVAVGLKLLVCRPNSPHMEHKAAAPVVLDHEVVSSLCASSPAL